MMGYLIALAIIVLFSLEWREQPARISPNPGRTGTNKRKEDPERNRSLKS